MTHAWYSEGPEENYLDHSRKDLVRLLAAKDLLIRTLMVQRDLFRAICPCPRCQEYGLIGIGPELFCEACGHTIKGAPL